MKTICCVTLAIAGLALHAGAASAQSSFEVTATVVPIDNVRMPAREAGVIREFLVRENELVQKGQPVVRLENDIHKMQLDVAQQELEMAHIASINDVDVRYARKTLEVAKKEVVINEKAKVPLVEMERSELEVVRAELSIEQAQRDQSIAVLQETLKQTERDAAQLRLDRRTITSPIEGTVVERIAQAGEWVNAGDPVMRVINLKRLYAKALLKASDYDGTLLGREVKLTIELPPHGEAFVFPGKITIVSPEVNPVTGEFLVTAEIENLQMKLRPGSNGLMTILRDATGN